MAFGDYIGKSTTQFNEALEATVQYGGAVTGNLLVAQLRVINVNSVTFPATIGDWTLATQAYNGSLVNASAIYYKIAGEAATESITFTWNDNGSGAAMISEWEGPFNISVIDTAADNVTKMSSATAVSVGQGSLTPSVNGCLLISFLGVNQRYHWSNDNLDVTNKITQPSGFTRRAVHGYQNTRPFLEHASVVQGTASLVNGTWSTVYIGGPVYAATVAFAPLSAFQVIDVNDNEEISAGDTGVVVTLSGTVSATGKRVFLSDGTTRVEQSVTGETPSTVTFDVVTGSFNTGTYKLQVWDPA